MTCNLIIYKLQFSLNLLQQRKRKVVAIKIFKKTKNAIKTHAYTFSFYNFRLQQ